MISSALLTSNSQEWETPDTLFNALHGVYNFTIDACASKENTKLPDYWDESADGLSQSWKGHRIWMNPPYQNKKPGQIAWVRKAYHEVKDNGCDLAVCLLPARTDTRLFHDYVMKSSMVYFIRGRLRFVGAKAGAVFPSLVVLFERCTYTMHPLGHKPTFVTIDTSGRTL